MNQPSRIATALTVAAIALVASSSALAGPYKYRVRALGIVAPAPPALPTISQGGLTWSAPEMPGVIRTLAQQQTYCQNLVVSGMTSWRLPTVAQLSSFAQSNAIVGTPWTKGWYWSSERRDSTFVFVVSLDPVSMYGMTSFINDPFAFSVSCVR